MGRLIDTDELKEIIDGNENLIDLQKDEMKLCIDACDTAYDVEAVVKELEEYMDENKRETNSGFIEVCIDIVRKGGVK